MSSITFSRAALALTGMLMLPAINACSSESNDSVEVKAADDDTVGVAPERYRDRRLNKNPAPIETSTPPAPTATTAPTTTPTASPTTTSTSGTGGSPPSTPSFHGVNLSGAEFGSALPGTDGTDYTWPTNSEVDYYVGKGLTTFRIPFMWERLQESAYGSFNAAYAASLDSLVKYATSKGAYVDLSPQNFARYYNTLIGSSTVPDAVFADFWSKVATKYASNPHVIFGLMNEPNTMPTEQWVSAANAAIAAIRATGATNLILVPGNNWTGAYSWDDSFYGTPNSVALLAISDPGNNSIFEAHQYLDSDSSGSSDQCVSTTIGTQRLAPFIAWLRANGKRGIVAEFAGGRNATCYAAVTDMLTTMKASSDVIEGWMWWGAGPWWGGDSYPFELDPINGVDQPQMALLTPFASP